MWRGTINSFLFTIFAEEIKRKWSATDPISKEVTDPIIKLSHKKGSFKFSLTLFCDVTVNFCDPPKVRNKLQFTETIYISSVLAHEDSCLRSLTSIMGFLPLMIFKIVISPWIELVLAYSYFREVSKLALINKLNEILIFCI